MNQNIWVYIVFIDSLILFYLFTEHGGRWKIA